jgi:small GTP-binding protein
MTVQPLRKKICLLGAIAVGKTSMVARYVSNHFSEKYKTTIGVKIDKKTLTVGPQELTLMIWDLAGEELRYLPKVDKSYFVGASGLLLVVDGTRRSTIDTAFALRERAEEVAGKVPFIVAINKADLTDSWEVTTADIDDLTARGFVVVRASAKTGQGVEEAFQSLARRIVE